jgi:hypothetical protein
LSANDASLFVGIAEVAGVFVGFGALIAVIRAGDIAPPQLGLIRVLVTVSLVVIMAAVVPVVVAHYGIEAHAVWVVSSLTFLALSWIVIGLALTSPDYHRTVVGQARRNRTRAVAFWVLRVLLWAAIQVPLVLTVLGVNPDLDVAFYLSALAFNLFEAAFILAQVVYAQVADIDD